MKKYAIFGVILSLAIGFFVNKNVNAASQTYYYNQAIVDFWTDHQVDATVNLPWNANPGTNPFWLHNVWANDTHYQGQNLAFISGRAVMEVRNFGVLPDGSVAGNDLYFCGSNMNQLSFSTSDPISVQCYGSMTVVYSDNTQTVVDNIYVFRTNWTGGNTMSGVIYFDYSAQLNQNKQINFIQYRFYGRPGHDLIARTSNWYNVNLFTLFEVRASIDAYQDMSGVSADLLQQQIDLQQQQFNQEQDDRNDLSEQQGDTEQQASSAGQQATTTGTTLYAAFTQLITALGSVNGNSCVLPNMSVYSLNFNNMDLCIFDIPPQIMALVSIGMVFIIVPLGINLVKRMISLYKEIIG